ncbi:MAG: DUF3596 domain-containing protein, partial [Pseudomonadota bacterium]
MPPRKSKYPGIESSGKTIRIWFMYMGKKLWENLDIPPTEPNRKHAARLRAQLVQEIRLSTFNWQKYFPNSSNQKYYLGTGESPKLIEEQLQEWFDLNAPTWKSSTKNDYRKSLSILSRQFGKGSVVDFKRRHATEWARTLNCGSKRLGNLISPLRQALDLAVEDELIPHNPLTGWSYKIKTAPKKKPDV